MDEARFAEGVSGLVPETDGWFVVNARDAAWASNDAFGSRCVFEASPRVVQGSDVEPRFFPQVGINLDVIMPGQPSGLYHSETDQEDMLVLHGECVLRIEGEERRLTAWDFVHCPPGTAHSFVGAGDGPCVIFMVGARGPDKGLFYPEANTSSAREAYAPYPPWHPARPAVWNDLPWVS
ncbi:MAG TPA: cupin domain-containing protein [Gaiellaceae bacterium]|nr:cupin domain-containing protein [Gaiellaceae bacterium]